MSLESFEFAGIAERAARFESKRWTALIHALDSNKWKVFLYRREENSTPPSCSVVCGEDESAISCWPAPIGSSFPEMHAEVGESGVILETSDMKVEVSLPDFRLEWYIRGEKGWLPLVSDRRTGAYNFDGSLGGGVCHYLSRSREDLHFGLGEKTGNVIKTGGSYRMCNVDCMGYDARSTDPLYKHFPYYAVKTKNGFYGVFYDTPEDCVIDLGRELDNYHGLYQYFRSGGEHLIYYVFGGESLSEIVTAFARLGGAPAFPPKWSLGYLASSMAYTDAPNAQALLAEFLEKCRAEDLPVSGFHLSSGYTLIGEKRCVFHWDKSRFPDPAALFAKYAQDGVKMIANVKPCLLTGNPLYDECAGRGLFVQSAEGGPLLSRFWDGLGSYLDFTNPETAAWWEQQVIDCLLEYGIEATWNDNNEFEIWDESAKCKGVNGERAAHRLKPLLTLSMLQASLRAQERFLREKRPFLISRAGCHGMQRYVQTWSGDNLTDWRTLRYNHKMGLGMSLSGIYNFGHDVGGFAGEKPGPELFLRWVQHGIFMPRFTIHSWNDDGSVNEPWMYPEITPLIRRLIVLRYRLMPYLYNLLYRSCTLFEPIIRPVFYNFPGFSDYESDLYMLGRDMLVANVFDSGVSTLAVTLPEGAGWYDLWSGAHYGGGGAVTCDLSPDRPVPVFMREGSVLLYDAGVKGFETKNGGDLRCVVFAPEENDVSAEFFIDDGESFQYLGGGFSMPRITASPNGDCLVIGVQNMGKVPLDEPLGITVIDRRKREVRLNGGNLPCRLIKDGENTLLGGLIC